MAKVRGGFKVIVDRISLIRIARNILRMREVALDASEDEFREVTEAIKRSSKVIVPYKTGALYQSAYNRVTRRSDDILAEVGYDDDERLGYAWVRHQVPAKTYTTPGTTHRYLTLAFDQYEDVIDDIVFKAFKKRLKLIGFKETVSGGF